MKDEIAQTLECMISFWVATVRIGLLFTLDGLTVLTKDYFILKGLSLSSRDVATSHTPRADTVGKFFHKN